MVYERDVGIEDLLEENKGLRQQLDDLQNKLDSQNKLLNEYNKTYLQRCRVKLGKKIAYREDASVEAVMDLVNKGKTYEEIAALLNISTGTVWRRIKVYRSNTLRDGEDV